MTEIPLFPLRGVVLFPGSYLPLHIFEKRYRQMIEDVSKRDWQFGVINVIGDTRIANVGCVAKIIKLEKLHDGRSNVITVGVERFTIVKEIDTSPYPRAIVEKFCENSTNGDGKCVERALTALFETLQLAARLEDQDPLKAVSVIPKDAKELSFLIASALPGMSFIKQDLLEMNDTELRLAREIPLLETLRARLRACIAIEDAFEDVAD